MSPHLDVDVAGVRSWLSACDEAGLGQMFAELDDWGGFKLPRGASRPFHLTYWLNEYQHAIVSNYVAEGWAMDLFVSLRAASRLGPVRPDKILHISGRDVA